MDIFDILNLIGGLCLFLFGMTIMGDSLERRAGGSLKLLLGKLTKNKAAGLITGLGVTAVIQSSSATTVMVVGFVNSGIMTLKQAISIIMGANVGTTVTSWVLSLGGISGESLFIQLLKPTSFTPILALIGTAMLMFSKSSKSKDSGTILLSFATLMFGMDAMTGAVKGLADIPAFQNLFLLFKNPLLGLLVGAVLTAIIQSSSASVGVLQALSATGQVSYGAALPIIMGQNIGTCITAILSSLGTTKNAKRAAVVHLAFNVIGAFFWLGIYSIFYYIFKPAFLDLSTNLVGIAVAHSAFNILCTALMLPMSGLLERLAIRLIPDSKSSETFTELDERLLATPPIALDRCNTLVCEMAEMATTGFISAMDMLFDYDPAIAQQIRDNEDKSDHYEDILGSYLVKLSANQMSDEDSSTTSKLLKLIGDYERISDHSVNVLESAEELNSKGFSLSDHAKSELKIMRDALAEILTLSKDAYINNNLEAARLAEPLEEVIDDIKDALRNGHIRRLKAGTCSIEVGFVWADLLTDMERTSDHCANIALCVLDSHDYNMNLHESEKTLRINNMDYNQTFDYYKKKYKI